ncbi:MAG: CU044_5270 family protein [Gaiellaceae bacterium]
MSIRLTPPPERDFPARRLQQRKEQLVSQIQTEHQRQQWPLRRRWPLSLGAAAAVAAMAIAVTAVLPAGDKGGPSPAAAAVLLHAARAAASRPVAAPPAPGQFVYTKSEGVVENTSVPNGGQAFNFLKRVTREAWIGPDGSGRIHQVEGSPRFVTSADRAAWVAAGKPDLNDGSGDMNTTFGPGGLHYLDLSKLPTDPAQLKQLIEKRTIEGGPPGDGETFTIIGDLLRETYAPPAVRSALYTIAAELPGIQLIGATHDQLGRPGTAVAYVSHGLSHELIFDPQTSALIGEQTVLADPSQANYPFPAGTVLDWTSYLRSGVVDLTTATP